MRILIAEDESLTRRLLEVVLSRRGYDIVVARDGAEAWEMLKRDEAPKLAVLDWVMPKMNGLEVCQRVRELSRTTPTYIIILTTKGKKEDILAGFKAGANDYITKPFDREELCSRVGVGARVVELEKSLAHRVKELEDALSEIKQLRGILPICSYCKSIRGDQNYWQQVESYFTEHSDVQFSHGFCPDCYEKFVKPEMDRFKSGQNVEDTSAIPKESILIADDDFH